MIAVSQPPSFHSKSMISLGILVAIATGLVAGVTGTARAAGEVVEPAAPELCEKGKVPDPQSKTCVALKSGVLPDAELTTYAWRLAKAERYAEALATLDLLKTPETAQALNYRGYATRKLGKPEESLAFYLKAITLDPKHVGAREYLGEAYVTLGRLPLAEEQLAKIKEICGNTTCEEYGDLQRAIAAKKKS